MSGYCLLCELHRTCSEQNAAPVVEAHFKYNGPMHPAMAELMVQRQEGDRFISYATAVFVLYKSLNRTKSKYDCELGAYDRNKEEFPEKKWSPPKQNYFYSATDRLADRLRRHGITVAKQASTAKATKAARARKKEERARDKAEAKEAKKQKQKGKKKPKKDKEVVSLSDSSSESESEDDDEEEDEEEGCMFPRTCSEFCFR